MRFQTLCNVTMIIVAFLAILNIILFSSVKIASVSIVNNKTNVKLINDDDDNIKTPVASFIFILILSIIVFILGLFKKKYYI